MAMVDRQKIILNHLQKPRNIYFGKTSSQQYLYTVDNNVLTKEQRDFYETNGYIIIRKLISDDILDECKQRFIDYCDKKIDLNGAVLVKDSSLMKTNATGQYLYNKIQYVTNDEIFEKYWCHPDILKYVERFIGPDISLINSMLINKPPNSNITTSVHPLHQDSLYIPFRPFERTVGSWTAMEKVTVDNGCLFVIPGTHKSAMQPHVYPNKDLKIAYYGIQGFDVVPKVNLEMEKGDTVFFNTNLMHGSLPNVTKGFRKAISGHYASNHCHYVETKGTVQEECANEYVRMAKLKGLDLNIQELWRYLYNKIQYVQDDVVFSKYFNHPDILKYVECFIGPDISLVNSMLINKPPNAQNTTSVHPLHQDLLYSPSRPVQGLIGTWTAMEKAAVDNGCLFVIPGTHKSVLQPHVYPHDGKHIGYFCIEGFDLVPKVNLEMEKGDTVFFHPLLMHGSWPNISQKFRKALSCNYISNHSHFIETKGTLHEKSADEFVKMAKKVGIDLSIQELWRSRSRIIKGKPGYLQHKYISPEL